MQAQLSSQGTLDEQASLCDISAFFAELWQAADDSPSLGWAQVFTSLREDLLQLRRSGKLPNEGDIRRTVTADRVTAAIAKFKSGTSTGICHIELARLKEAPLCVITDLTVITQDIVIAAIGPARGNEVILGAIPK